VVDQLQGVSVVQRSEHMESAHTAEMAVAVAKVTRLLSLSRGILPGVVPTQEALTAYIVAERTVAGTPISLKALVNTVGLSQSGLRKPLQRLLDGDWVAIKADTIDGRGCRFNDLLTH
jgi:hypothetical protein